MATASELALLAQALGGESDYLAKDPFFMGGRAFSQMALPAPTNDLEAWLGPALQGGLTGLLTGYGRSRAEDQAYKDYRPYLQSALQNPYNSFVGPLTSQQSNESNMIQEAILGADPYAAEMRPEDWTIGQGRLDLLQKALAAENQQALEMEQAKSQSALQEMLLKDYGAVLTKDGQIETLPALSEALANKERMIAEAKAAGQMAGGLSGGLMKPDDLAKEVGTVANKEQSIQFIDNAIQIAKKQNDKGMGALGALTGSIPFVGVPTAEKQTLDAIGEAMVGQVDKVLGRETNSDARTRLINQFGPKWYDSDAEIERKGELFKEYVKSLSPATPGLSAAGLTPSNTSGLPSVGSIFNGEKVLSIKKVG